MLLRRQTHFSGGVLAEGKKASQRMPKWSKCLVIVVVQIIHGAGRGLLICRHHDPFFISQYDIIGVALISQSRLASGQSQDLGSCEYASPSHRLKVIKLTLAIEVVAL
jgi:hypothetical protein